MSGMSLRSAFSTITWVGAGQRRKRTRGCDGSSKNKNTGLREGSAGRAATAGRPAAACGAARCSCAAMAGGSCGCGHPPGSCLGTSPGSAAPQPAASLQGGAGGVRLAGRRAGRGAAHSAALAGPPAAWREHRRAMGVRRGWQTRRRERDRWPEGAARARQPCGPQKRDLTVRRSPRGCSSLKVLGLTMESVLAGRAQCQV